LPPAPRTAAVGGIGVFGAGYRQAGDGVLHPNRAVNRLDVAPAGG